MILVIDANIVISALLSSQGKTFDLIFSDEVTLFAPEYLIDEFSKHEHEIVDKSGLPHKEVLLLLSLISGRISFMLLSGFRDQLTSAGMITPDINDTEYLALA